jgi:hypothetical protein
MNGLAIVDRSIFILQTFPRLFIMLREVKAHL